MRRKGSILVGLLWCLALLSVATIGVLHTARLDLMVVKNYGDRMQAHYLALAGIEKAKALLHQNARSRSRSRVNHSGELYNSPADFRNVTLGRGRFQVFHYRSPAEGGGQVWGVEDGESRLNVNLASAAELGRIDGLTPEIAAAIVDWRDADNAVTTGGAEAEYYASLKPPYRPRNGPLQTLRELLMVRGISPQLLGNTAKNSGWSGWLTAHSLGENSNAAGEDRVNVQTADETTLTSINGITADIARAIVGFRGVQRLESLDDLLEVRAVATPNRPPASQNSSRSTTSSPPPAERPTPTGPALISQDLLLNIADDVTTDSSQQQSGLVNINTASWEVLACLPGLDRELARAIVSYRDSNGFFPNVACLLKVSGLTRAIFKQVAPRVATRSETFRLLSEGQVTSSHIRQRMEVVVHIGRNQIDTLAYREDDL